MTQQLQDRLQAQREAAYLLLRRYLSLGRPFLLRSELRDVFDALCLEQDDAGLADSPLARIVDDCQEAVLAAPWVCLALRPRIGRWSFVRIHADDLGVEELTVSRFLEIKEHLVCPAPRHTRPLEFDIEPFNREFPQMRETRSIGRGMEFLNRKLSSQLFDRANGGLDKLFLFLREHRCDGRLLMINDHIGNVDALRTAIRDAEKYLSRQRRETAWSEIAHELQHLGFEPGWGAGCGQSPGHPSPALGTARGAVSESLERFLARIPMIFSLLILSPHGFFGQAGVLGLPDTGGQVVYILDQVRALEREMRDRLSEQGLEIEPRIRVVTRLIPEARGTTCDEPEEAISGTEGARILRVPSEATTGRSSPSGSPVSRSGPTWNASPTRWNAPSWRIWAGGRT
jgi:sucrose synthase